jgi:RHS repeat-associated protein
MLNLLISSSLRLKIGYALLVISLSSLFWTQTFAQGSTAGGWTPPGIAPGAPAGSYPLSGIEQINPFNGNMNASIPLLQVGGRGEAGYTIPLRISPDPWIVESQMWSWYNPYSEEEEYHWSHYASHSWWNPMSPGYSPGVMNVRQSTAEPFMEGGSITYHRTLTRLTFTAPDGTEYEFVDQISGGEGRYGGMGRGREWTTKDNGTSATFISDVAIVDLYMYQNLNIYGATGDMYMKNGVRYRIVDGVVLWMRDRNGNKVSFTYNAYKNITKAVDSLNREVTFEYAVNDYPYGICDRILWKGTGGEQRIIRITRTNLINCLRAGSYLQTNGQLFPVLSATSTYNPAGLASALTMPDGRSYQFRYNSFGELARVELPTGGGMEYDYDKGDASLTATGVWGPYWATGVVAYPSDPLHLGVARRMSERRVYSDAANYILESKVIYDMPVITGTINNNHDETSAVVIRNQDAYGNQINAEKHYFNGSVIGSLSWDDLITGPRPWQEGKEYQTEALDAGSNILRRSNNTWVAGALPGGPQITDTITTLVDTNQISKQHSDHDIYGNNVVVDEYDYGSGAPGSLVRRTKNTYLSTNPENGAVYNNPYPVNIALPMIHLRGLPTKTQVFADAAETVKKAEAIFEYDKHTTANHAALVNRTNISGFDATFSTTYTWRGNITGATSYENASALTGVITSNAQYDIAGNVVKTVDAKGNAANLYYEDNFGAADGNAQTGGNPTNTAPSELSTVSQSAFAFPYKITNALNHTGYTQLDYYSGKPVDAENPNGIKASLYYNDPLDRPTKMINGLGITTAVNQTLITYDDANKVVTVARDKDANTDGLLVSKAYYDGLGRTWRKASFEGGSNWSIVETQFDALGRSYRSSNPFRGTSPTAGLPTDPQWTTSTFDALGRVTQTMTPDGSHVDTLYSGNQVTITDQANKKRKTETDGLGRLCKVWEDPSGLNYLTSYSYDTLDNLMTVTQGVQTRTFAYDSLKRLTSALDPESGTTAYTYDSNGNTLTKTDARTAKVTLAYDSLNRPISKTYSGTTTEGINAANATPPVYYKYDSQAFPTGAPAGFNRGFAVGKLVAVNYGSSTASTGNYFGYDELGREVRKTQQINSTNYPITASYNRASMMTGETYPSTRTASYGYNVAGQLTSFSGNIGDGTTRNYITSATYTAAGNKEREVYGMTTPLYLNLAYNKRQQMVDLRLSSTTDPQNWNRGALITYYGTNSVNIWNPFADDTDNNGNVRRSLHYVPLNDANTSSVIPQLADYTYDSLDRVSSFTEAQHNGSAWTLGVDGQNFSYDQYGNRKITSAIGGVNGYNPTYTVSNNKIVGMTYDSAGNITNDGVRTMTYDAENRMVAATSAGGTGTYAYDGEGKRVKRATSTQSWWYVYGLGGELVAEYLSTAPTTVVKEYGYRDGKLLVVGETGNVRWMINDHLGSTRMTADGTGSLAGMKRQDYLPFGEDLYAGIRRNGANGQYGYEPPLSTTRQKFTGYERDVETGLDFAQARYYSNTQGRFTSVDPSLKSISLVNPQTLNRYSYTANNPLANVDRNGKWHTGIHNKIIDHALSGLAGKQREVIKKASEKVDKNQGGNASYMHGMQSNGDSKNMAARRSSDFINGNINIAKQKQKEFKGSGVSDEALKAFAEALHTITDMTSPQHEGYQRWQTSSIPFPGGTIGNTARTVGDIGSTLMHAAGELGFDFYSQGLAAGATRKAYSNTFGVDMLNQATGGIVLGSENDPTVQEIHRVFGGAGMAQREGELLYLYGLGVSNGLNFDYDDNRRNPKRPR